MKASFVALLLLVGLSASAQWPWSDWKKVDGNGVLKKETRSVSGYTGISSSGSWDVMVAYGESNTISIEGDENLLDYIETKVEDGVLKIRSQNVNLRSRNKITVYVSLTKLSSVTLSGSGSIIGEGNYSSEGKTEFKTSGSGRIQMGFGKLDKVYARVSGSGNIKLKGTANSVETHISGSGGADCRNVISDDATVQISGSGNVQVNANRRIEARISGSGNATYYGAARDVSTHVSGSGRLRKGS